MKLSLECSETVSFCALMSRQEFCLKVGRHRDLIHCFDVQVGGPAEKTSDTIIKGISKIS